MTLYFCGVKLHVGQNITALKIMIDGGVEDRMLSFPFLSGTLF